MSCQNQISAAECISQTHGTTGISAGMLPQTIENVEQISELVRQQFPNWKQFGEVDVRSNGRNLLIFNYNRECQYAGRWNKFEQLCRGLIVDKNTGEIVARPFDKFFNWGEQGMGTTAPIVHITEKMDGSLGIGYREDGILKVSTRGSFDSDQAAWATGWMRQNVDTTWLTTEWTPLMEVIYPENRVVVNYGDYQGLVLIGMRNRFTGDEAPLDFVRECAMKSKAGRKQGFDLPQKMSFESIEQILQAKSEIDVNQEGWVVLFADGQRFKFKGDQYLELARQLKNLSFKVAFQAVRDGNMEALRREVPEEYYDLVDSWEAEVNTAMSDLQARVDAGFEDVKKNSGAFDATGNMVARKTLASYVLGNHKKVSSFIFGTVDKKDMREAMFDTVFENMKKAGRFTTTGNLDEE